MKQLLLLLLLGLPLALGAAAMPETTRVIVSPAVVLSVHDGDTLRLAILGSHALAGPFRLARVLAKEVNTTGGKRALAHLQELLPSGSAVRVQLTYTESGNVVQSLCRPIADVWVESTGLHINEAQAKFLKEHRLWGGTGQK